MNAKAIKIYDFLKSRYAMDEETGLTVTDVMLAIEGRIGAVGEYVGLLLGMEGAGQIVWDDDTGKLWIPNLPIFRGYTKKELSDAFKMVRDEGHWKNGFKKVIRRRDWDRVKAAVIFYHASEPKVVGLETDYYMIEGDGYAAW